MGKLLSFHVTSVDGYYEGPGQAFDWPVVDEEFNQFALQQLEAAARSGETAGLLPGSVPG
jgi:hypothetical protein